MSTVLTLAVARLFSRHDEFVNAGIWVMDGIFIRIFF